MLSLCRPSTAEYRYKLRGPPRPPAPPLPPPLSIHRPGKHPAAFYKTKYPGPRVSGPLLRGPPAFLFDQHRHAPRFHGPPHLGRLSPPALQPQALLFGPPAAEHFPPAFEPHTTARPVLYPGLGVDDDKGPIHTIPAPNLSLLDRPHGGAPAYPHALGEGFPSHVAQPAHSLVSAAQQPSQLAAGAYAGSGGVSIQPSISYQVREETNDHAGETYDGKPVYFAPDPDPNLPAPKIPPTNDPHSVPSNGRSPAELLVHHLQSQGTPLQLFETSTNVMHDGQSLSSQDLYRLLQGSLPQQQQLLDTYPLPLLQQPQLQQHILQQQAAGFPPALLQFRQHGEVADNSLALRSGGEEFRPQLQSFSYEEHAADQAQYSSRPHFTQVLDQGDEEAAGSAPEPQVVRGTGEAAGGAAREGQDSANEVEDPGKAALYSKVAQGAQLYSSLPSREAAEALATLAAAGNVNSHFMSRLNGESSPEEDDNQGYGEEDQDQDQDQDQEQEEEEEEYDNQPSSTTAPATTTPGRRLPQTYQQQRQRYQPQPARAQLTGYYQVGQEEEADEPSSEDPEAGHELQFGARIRPKRDDGSGD
ncbi:putative NAD(+)--arginine ADP-ribosyltransferase Mav [Bacillus rossius redtenbacheri]|uniref:putative NAD(+)--arginine ADP-ribosyltransferase Mav n=1 Tax=Bacillus rossius redtenbacheri TaxID=93214 RepID=UPI002FDCFE7F